MKEPVVRSKQDEADLAERKRISSLLRAVGGYISRYGNGKVRLDFDELDRVVRRRLDIMYAD